MKFGNEQPPSPMAEGVASLEGDVQDAVDRTELFAPALRALIYAVSQRARPLLPDPGLHPVLSGLLDEQSDEIADAAASELWSVVDHAVAEVYRGCSEMVSAAFSTSGALAAEATWLADAMLSLARAATKRPSGGG